jgi:thiosulfate reductase cytochrome b subunit
MARRWHLFFAWLFVVNGVAYVLYTIFSRHLARDLVPTRFELRNVGRSILDHIKLKHPTGDAALRYNVLQSLTYLVVIFGLLPLVVICGMALSPRLNAVFTGWVDLLGGRQSARSLHFLAALGLVLFVVVHVVEVVIAGVWNEMRSMITGWYRVPEDPKEKLPS